MKENFKIIMSPAKNMRNTDDMKHIETPVFQSTFHEKTEGLVNILKNYSPYELEKAFKVNEKIAQKAFLDYQCFDKVQWLAILAYDGLAYKYLKAEDFSKDDLLYAKEHLYILSALYGVLSPLDGISPYRLDYDSKVPFNLYEYWGSSIYDYVFKEESTFLINLASNEYYKCISPYLKTENRVLTCTFLSMYKGKLKTLPAIAKMARGEMARYIIKGRIETVEEIKEFSGLDFVYDEFRSNESEFVFVNNKDK